MLAEVPEVKRPAVNDQSEMRYIDAIQKSLDDALLTHKELILMGQDIAEYGGVFKVTEGFVETFGKERVRNTPLCESAIVGAALGLSIKGMKVGTKIPLEKHPYNDSVKLRDHWH